MNKFFKAFRKRGFSLTLEILNEFPKGETVETNFFNKLKSSDSYLNEFYRVKEELLKYGLVAYKLDGEYNKVIYITKKGRELLQHINEIEDLLVEKK